MLKGKTVTVGTTAVDLLAGIETDRPLQVLVRYDSLGIDLFLGDSTVTTSNGFKLDRADTSIQRFAVRDQFYVIAGGTGTIHVLVTSAS